jgi:V/A-type H+-transporting ATPase subunit K
MEINFGLIGASVLLGITAFGSGVGINIVGQATVGAWKKCYLNNKAAPMLFLAFTGNPATQTFYAYILTTRLVEVAGLNPANALVYLGYSLAAALALASTAIVQGKVGACCIEAMVETKKGFAQYYAVMGIAEAIALFTMVFTITLI